MKRTARGCPSRTTRTSSEEQIAGLRASTSARKQETVERLGAAIESLKNKQQAITAQSIYAECGLHYSTYVRNKDAIALFRANSTHLLQKKKQKRKHHMGEDTLSAPSPHDPYLNYKKLQLVLRLREAQQQLQALRQQQAILADACLQQDARVGELEAKLAELEPYRDFVEQIRQRVQREEYNNGTPPSS